MSLQEYRRKRSFDQTPEPRGSDASPSPSPSPSLSGTDSRGRFVVQKHDATQLHYDLRLELDGVLKSWAVPKGPSLDPREKRLAIQVEDHPLEYLDFEGSIPRGTYGGGTVMVWDTGDWQCDNPADYHRGELKFALDGHKLQGRWMLVRTGKKAGRRNHWLLFKERDAFARDADEFNVLAAHPLSVLSHRSLEQIVADRDMVCTGDTDVQDSSSGRQASTPQRRAAAVTRKSGARIGKRTASPQIPQPSSILQPSHPKARRAALPASPQPALPSPTMIPPAADTWVHELKFDGYRMMGIVQNNRAKFLSRNGRDWSDKLPRLAAQLLKLPARQFVVDGEVVFVSADGTTNFQSLQNAINHGDDRQLRYYLFDLIYLDGFDLTQVPLLDRKSQLQQLVQGIDGHSLIYSDHIRGDGQLVFQKAAALGAEGIVCKRLASTYPRGRTTDWLKVKCLQSAEFVVGGFTPSNVRGDTLGALCLGRFDAHGKLQYEGRVGTGFSAVTQDAFWPELQARRIERTQFCNVPASERGCHWVKPELVVEVEFTGWTREGRLRFPVFRGRRDDLAATQVRQEAKGKPAEAAEMNTAHLSPATGEALQQVRWTHADRVLYPDMGTTKYALAIYYASIWNWMAPQIVDRPLAIVRFPKGVGATSFFQKSAADGMPDSIERFVWQPTDRPAKPHHAMVVKDLRGLLTLVQFSALEIHGWGARYDRVQKPDRLVFDLDPHESVAFARVVQTAFELRELLSDLDLQCFVTTTGGKGLHVVLPLRRTCTWDLAKEFAVGIATIMERRSPGRYTTKAAKAARQGKLYLDTLRNGLGATSIVPYSTRGNPTCGIATPLTWDELPYVTHATMFHVNNILRRMQSLKADPWHGFCQVRQSITRAMVKQLGK